GYGHHLAPHSFPTRRSSDLPEQEIAGDMSANHVGLQARMMSQAMRKLSGVISKTNVVAIFINQIREKVGIMFGNPETTPGGRARSEEHTSELQSRENLVCRL